MARSAAPKRCSERSWSNSETFLGRDPCAPADVQKPYIVGIPDQSDVIHYFNRSLKGIKLSPGQERNFLLRRYATEGAEAKLCNGRGVHRFRGTLGKLELPPIEIRVE